MHPKSRALRHLALAGLAAGLVLAVSCGSNNNKSTNNQPAAASATKAASAAATQAAATSAATSAATAAATKAASPAAAGSPSAGAVAMTFSPPGGSAPWSNVADGCHGVPLPPGAEQPKASDVGVTPTEIKLGSTFGLTGAGSSYAPIIKVVQDCFNAINADGGIYGRKLNLIIKDDQYLAANTPPLTQQLVEQEKVFAMLSSLGTPTQSSVFDYLNQQKVPQMFVATGAAKWGADPQGHPWSMGFQPDYFTEGQIYAKYIQQNLKGKKIGILRQNDDFGKDYVDGLKKVLGDKGTADNPIIDEEVYESTDADVAGQITNLKNKGAEILYLIAIPKFAGLALRDAAQQGWHPAVVMTDVSNDPTLNDLAGGKQNTEGVITDYYYHQFNENVPAVQTVKDFIAKNDPNLQLTNFVIFGYMQGQAYVEMFKRAGVNLTRQSFMQAAESFQNYQIPQLLPGITLNTSKTDHRPIKCIVMAVFHDGVSQPQGNAICAGS